MSVSHETKVQELVDAVKGYGKPMFVALRVITWELPLSYATIFTACSLLYVVLYNLSIKTFSVLGLLTLWLDYYCCQNKILTSELTKAEKDHLYVLCSKLITLQTKVTETFKEIKAAQNQNPSNFLHHVCLLLGLAILVSWFVDNLLLCYLIGSTALLMVGMSCPQSDFIPEKSSSVKLNPKNSD